MDYCDDCGGLVVPQKKSEETRFECRSCGKEHERNEEGEMKITEKNVSEKKSIDVEDRDTENLPTTEEECEECGHGEAYWWMMQTRSADEPETRFFRCTECGHTWRSYD